MCLVPSLGRLSGSEREHYKTVLKSVSKNVEEQCFKGIEKKVVNVGYNESSSICYI